MTRRVLDLTPDTHSVLAGRDRDFTFPQCTSELVDNSLDAGSGTIDIDLEKPDLIIKDDGCGCDDVEKMLRQGGHVPHPTTTSGRFGVGLKDSSQWAADELHIETTTATRRTKVAVDWLALARSGNWKGSVVSDYRDGSYTDTGTTIRLRGLRRTPRMPDIIRALEHTFSPALVLGKTIRANGVKISPYKPPKLTEQIQLEFSVRGMLVRGSAGVVADGEKNPHAGFNLSNNYRTICTTTIPANGYSTGNFYSSISLIGRWPLSRNKESIPDEALFDELCNELGERCSYLLEKAQRQSMSVSLSRLRAEANELTANLFGGSNGRGGGSGGGKGGNTGGDRPVPDASRGTKGKRPSGIQIDFSNVGDGSFAVVDVDGRRVIFNIDNEATQGLISKGKSIEVVREAILTFAAESSLIAHPQLKEFGESCRDRYRSALGKWMEEIYRRHQSRQEARRSP